MSEVKFTAGQWRHAASMEGEPFWCVLNERGTIAAMRIVGEENARLFSAAPELLAALEAAVARQGFTNEELIDARAIIKKAKGDSNV